MTRFSQRTSDLQASPIREILAVIDRPGMVSFAGGLPSADSFPTLATATLPPALLQYGSSEGEWALRETICAELADTGLHCTPEQVLILAGSQQGIDLTAKLFIDAGTPVAVEAPTYLAALQVFRYFGARLHGFRPGHFVPGSTLPRLLYTIPTFQNPTGYCYSQRERETLAAACDRHGIPVFEDDPYRDLYYDTCDRQPVCSLVKRTSWVYQGSFSKSFAPGLRLGYLACSRDLLPWYVRLKQAADLHSCRLSQHLVLQLLRDPGREARLARLREDYRARRDRFHQCLQTHLSPWCDWDKPPGGLFFWLRLKAPLDTDALLARAIADNVAFMPGRHFFPGASTDTTLRLNFSHAGEADMERGMRALAALLDAAVGEAEHKPGLSQAQ